MKQVFYLEGLECQDCASRIEREVGQLEGVRSSAVNVVSQTLAIQTEGADSAVLSQKIADIVKSCEPDVKVSTKAQPKISQSLNFDKSELRRLIIGAVLFLLSGLVSHFVDNIIVSFSMYFVTYLVLGLDVLLKAIRNIAKGKVFDENFLMSVSTIGAFCLGEFSEAAAVMLFYQVGELFQDAAVRRSRGQISALLDIRPDTARILVNGEEKTVEAEKVTPGEIMILRAGDRISLDGTVIEGNSFLNTSAVTGESAPRAVGVGDSVFSGCINEGGLLKVSVTKPFGESTASKMIDLVENAASAKAPTEQFITTFARYYTPIVVFSAIALGLLPPLLGGGSFEKWIHRALVFLIISCPCALVISVPLTFFGGLGAASGKGILIKGGNYLEALNGVRKIVFDKTGTLTKGTFEVQQVRTANGFSEESLLKYAAKCEQFSNHPIAKSVLQAYGKEPGREDVSDVTELAGRGIQAKVDGKTVLVGSARLLHENGIDTETSGQSVQIAVDGVFAGSFKVTDTVKADSKAAIEALRRLGVEETIMLTGDGEAAAEEIAEELGIDTYCANLLPDMKVTKLEEFKQTLPKGGKIAFVGDGMNDAPVLARADVGIAMGGPPTDAAIEAADVVLMADEPLKLADTLAIARRTHRIVMQNIVFALSVKALLLLLGALGYAGMWLAVFGDVGVAMLCVLNAMRMLKRENSPGKKCLTIS